MADAVVVQTQSVANWARGVVPSNKVCIIPNFVRSLPEVPPPGSRRKNEILAVGRLDRQKGFDLLIRAFARSGCRKCGYRLVLLGEGPERSSLQRLSRELNVEDALEMPGVVQDPERWMARAALFVLPSRYEGFPNVLLEAMGMGCPVIASACPSGPAEIVTHGEDGLLVPAEDVGALAAALRQMMDDATLRNRLGEAAAEVRERFSPAVVLTQWENLIQQVVERRRR